METLEDRRLLVATVSVTADAPTEIPEDSRSRIVYSLTRDETDGILAVQFELGGDAVFRQDYTAGEVERDTIWLPETPPATGPVTGTATFFPGESTVELVVRPVEDGKIERDEQVVLSVVAADEFGPVSGGAAKIVEDEETIYYAVDGQNRLATVDVVTGSVQNIGTIPAAQSVTDLAFIETGELFAVTRDHLFQLDPAGVVNGSVPTRFLGAHGIPNAAALIDARDGDFGSTPGDLFAVGRSFLDLQRIDLTINNGQATLNNVVTVFDIDGTLRSLLLHSDYIASGDLDYDTGGDLILSAKRPSEVFDSLIEIKTPGVSGVIENAPEPAEDPRETFAGIQGLAFDGNNSFGFAGHTLLRVNQFSRDSSRELEMTGRPYVIGVNPSASGTITGDPADPPVVTIHPTRTDPPDLDSGPQPTSWARQRSDVVEIHVQLGATVPEIPLQAVTLTNLGLNTSHAPTEIELRESNLIFTPNDDFFTILLEQGQLGDGRYELRLAPEITSGPEYTYVGDDQNRFYVLRGDWDGNAIVDLRDVATLAYWFGHLTAGAPQSHAPEYVDLDRSGRIDADDFPTFEQNFGSLVAIPGVPVIIDPELLNERTLERALISATDPLDVNGDTRVSPLDALNVLNRLAIGQTTVLDWRYDVNRDGMITPRDALRILNELAIRQRPSSNVQSIPLDLSARDDRERHLLEAAIDAVMDVGISPS